MIAFSKFKIGRFFSTCLPDIDFETYSEAGYIWNESLQKFKCPKGATKKGLPVIGSAVYAEHPSTEILSVAYNLKNGQGIKLWLPGQPLPLELFQYLAQYQDHLPASYTQLGIIEAHNSAFEVQICLKVLAKKYNWPLVNLRQFRCSSAKARAHALPGGLQPLGDALSIQHGKDKDGTRLLNKFSMPRDPTKKDPRKRILPSEDILDAENLYKYNERDTVAESEASSLIPDLPQGELDYWLADQQINFRGVGCDREAVDNCIYILEQALAKYNEELRVLTSGQVKRASELAKLKTWLKKEHNISVLKMDEEALDELLERNNLPDICRRAIEIRQLIGSASVKKVYAMARQATSDNNLCNMAIYHGARTGRDNGDGVQPLNMPKAGPLLKWCTSRSKPYQASLRACPWCGGETCTAFGELTPWSADGVDHVLEVIATRSLELVEYYFGNALLCISGCARGLFVARKGKVLMGVDYSSIEAVCAATLAGEQWRIEAFKTGRDIYLESAARITKKPYSYYEANGGKKHPDRQHIGKPAELGCFGPRTQVLTHVGYLDIVDVQAHHKLWDGIEWVNHQGLIFQGVKAVINLDGLKVTPDHKIICGHWWKAAYLLALSQNTLSLALVSGSANLPLWVRKTQNMHSSPVRAVSDPIPWRLITYVKGEAHNAIVALKKARLFIEKCFTAIQMPCRMTRTGLDCLIGYQPQSLDAITKKTGATPLTGPVGSGCAKNGGKTEGLFYATSAGYPAMKTKTLKWIGSTLTAITSPVILDSLLVRQTPSIKEKLTNFKPELPNLSDVYDIAHAGPRNRFTIKTSSGHLVVHNCGFGGWLPGWRQFDKTDTFTDEQVKQNILAWRSESPCIVEMWGGQTRGKPWAPTSYELFGLEGMAILAIQNPGQTYSYRDISYFVECDRLYCQLPSGRHLTYHHPRLSASEKWEGQLQISFMGWNSNPKKGALGWGWMTTYGAQLFENVVQAVARDIMAHGVLNLEAADYPVVLRVHDEVVTEVDECSNKTMEKQIALMTDLPLWAKGWPVRAAGWDKPKKRYQKD